MGNPMYEEGLIKVLNELIEDNLLESARKVLNQTKETFSQYQEFDTKLKLLEVKRV